MLRVSRALRRSGFVAGAVLVSCAVGSAVHAHAECDPVGTAMTPQPILTCSGTDTGAPADAPAAASAPPAGGQLSYLRQIWREFHNGVPSDLIYGPDPAARPPDPAAPSPPDDPSLILPPNP